MEAEKQPLGSGREHAGAGGVAPCAKSCGSLGTAATNYLCVRCFRDHLNAVDRAAEAARMRTLLARLGGEVPAPAVAVPKTTAETENRCAACRNNRVDYLLGFACRFGATFCAVHRHAEAHACRFPCRKKAGRCCS